MQIYVLTAWLQSFIHALEKRVHKDTSLTTPPREMSYDHYYTTLKEILARKEEGMVILGDNKWPRDLRNHVHRMVFSAYS
jgi:hypothetical protein